MDEIQTRLQDTAATCGKTYEAWRKDEKNADNREAFRESIHELRKVASRLEIELAVSERGDAVQKPIPIPPHRNAQGRRRGRNHQDGPDVDGNTDAPVRKPARRSSGPRKRRAPNSND